jgi:hypothetical protein
MKPIKTLRQFATHMQVVHGVSKEETSDMVRYFIMKLLPGRVETVVKTRVSSRVRGKWNLCRCHFLGCEYVSGDGSQVDTYMKKSYESMMKDIEALGWFWGTIHAMIKANPKTTIAEALG